MRHLIGLAALALVASGANAHQQRQVSIAEGVVLVSPDAPCPSGTVRRVYAPQQQVAQQGFGQAQHFCMRQEAAGAASSGQMPELTERAAWPTLIPLSSFGPSGTNADVALVALAANEFTALRQAVAGISFANYRLSGCHDRAHAAYLLLPPALQAKAVKLWVVAPSAYTRGVRGTITYPPDASVDWRYHVALAFAASEGLIVFDPTLSPGRLISEDEWLGSFRYPALSFRVFTPATTYQFYDEDDDVTSLNDLKSWIANKDIWVGNGYGYDGTALREHWIPANLARDAVGALVEAGGACPDLMLHRGNPKSLLAALQAGATTCATEASLYARARDEWIQRLR